MHRLIGINSFGKGILTVDYLVVAGGGGNGGTNGTNPTAGAVNKGAGGGGAQNTVNGAAGGSGTIVLKYPDTRTATFSGGVTQSTSSSGGFKYSIITAAGVSDTVSWA